MRTPPTPRAARACPGGLVPAHDMNSDTGQDKHHRGMASAIDDCPVRVLVSLKRGWHSPLEAYTLCLAWYRASTSREENARACYLTCSTVPLRSGGRYDQAALPSGLVRYCSNVPLEVVEVTGPEFR